VTGWFHTTPEKSLSPLEWTLAISPCLVQPMGREPPRDRLSANLFVRVASALAEGG
jgi:hypothetical protein